MVLLILVGNEWAHRPSRAADDAQQHRAAPIFLWMSGGADVLPNELHPLAGSLEPAKAQPRSETFAVLEERSLGARHHPARQRSAAFALELRQEGLGYRHAEQGARHL